MTLRIFVWLLVCPVVLLTQSTPARASSARPIPDAATLLREVVAHQRKMDSVRENYTYREVEVVQKLDGHGKVESTKALEYNVFFVNTHEIDDLVKKNGQALSVGEERGQQARLKGEIAQAEATPPGQSPDHQSVSVSQLLAIMRLSHPRRTIIDGRSTFVFDFTGKQHAHVQGKAEKALSKLTGTIWIDEKDREVRRLDAHFDANFRMGWGLVAVDKGSTFTFTQRPIRGGLWLPSGMQSHVVAHALAFFGYRANIAVTDSDYEVFHAGAEQVRGVQVVPEG